MVEDILATPHVVTGPNNYRWCRKNPQRHGNVLQVESASQLVSRIFIHPPWGAPSRAGGPCLCEEIGPRHRTAKGSGLPTAQYCALAGVHKKCPSSPHPLHGRWSRSRTSDTKVPQNAGNVPLWHQTAIPIVIPLHLPIMHGSLPIMMDGVEKRELEPESTKRGIAEVNLRIVALNPGLI